MLIVGYIHDDDDVCVFTYIDTVSTEDYSLLPRQHIEQCGGEPEQADTGILCIILLHAHHRGMTSCSRYAVSKGHFGMKCCKIIPHPVFL